jgi:DNA-binding transcriptional regulator YdaS (Cro superfamily)
MNGINKAIKKAGNANRLAKHLGVDRQLVIYWRDNGKPAPEHCMKINAFTGVPLHDLRPDVYPPETQNKAH